MEYFSDFDLEALVKGAVTTVVIIVGAIVVWMLASRSLQLLERRAKVSRTLLLPVRLVLRYGMFVIALLLILSSYGIPIGNFWTFVSTILGLVAIGFVAVWSVLSNMSATFLILLVQPFRVGDYVRIVGEDVMGDVTDINFMFTTIRSRNGNVFKVPNNQFFQKSILCPVDPVKLERKNEEKDAEKSESKPDDHSMANLEGVRLPGPGKGMR